MSLSAEAAFEHWRVDSRGLCDHAFRTTSVCDRFALMTAPLLEARVSRRFGHVRLDGADFAVHAEICALIGDNRRREVDAREDPSGADAPGRGQVRVAGKPVA